MNRYFLMGKGFSSVWNTRKKKKIQSRKQAKSEAKQQNCEHANSVERERGADKRARCQLCSFCLLRHACVMHVNPFVWLPIRILCWKAKHGIHSKPPAQLVPHKRPYTGKTKSSKCIRYWSGAFSIYIYAKFIYTCSHTHTHIESLASAVRTLGLFSILFAFAFCLHCTYTSVQRCYRIRQYRQKDKVFSFLYALAAKALLARYRFCFYLYALRGWLLESARAFFSRCLWTIIVKCEKPTCGKKE